MPTKRQRLDAIKQKILDDNVTPELAKQATQLVFGDGNPDADIVFIGEAPGKHEDEQGKPFVGAAGKFLNEMLASIGMKREDIYITNIVKYRPPDNRDPYPEEKKAFLPYLQAQLEVIRPKIVVTLGRHSLSCFLPDLQISKVHGEPKRIRINFHSFAGMGESQMPTDLDAAQGSGEERSKADKEVRRTSTRAADTAMRQEASGPDGLGSAGQEAVPLVILPLFHPAAALYNGSMKQTLVDDFSRIPKILQQVS